jgi:hypothetical protein
MFRLRPLPSSLSLSVSLSVSLGTLSLSPPNVPEPIENFIRTAAAAAVVAKKPHHLHIIVIIIISLLAYLLARGPHSAFFFPRPKRISSSSFFNITVYLAR